MPIEFGITRPELCVLSHIKLPLSLAHFMPRLETVFAVLVNNVHLQFLKKNIHFYPIM